ncbi:MAG: heat-shock protein Hsp20 [Bacteroidetes bacterium HGW-Bacteroidetes-11]|nr:MAG: heat-shock protein Hsp20 [Bacteroidetes bacterium HGW-Bacteroidetes-11]
MGNVMENFFNNPTRPSHATVTPANIFENENAFVIELAVPGYSKENFSITLDQQILKISADAKQHQIDDEKFLRKEFGLNGINRSFVLPKTVDTDNISADFSNGILSIRLPLLKDANIKKEIAIS